MKKVIISISVFLAIIIVTGTILTTKLFYIGNVRSINSTIVKSINVESNRVKVNTLTTNSSKAYKDYKYRVDNNIVYIKIYEVLASGSYRNGAGNIVILDDLSNINKIYLEDNHEEKLIWSK